MFGFLFSWLIGQRGQKISCAKTLTLPNLRLPVSTVHYKLIVRTVSISWNYLEPSPFPWEASAILARTTSVISEKFPMQLANLARTVVRRAITLYKMDISESGKKIFVCVKFRKKLRCQSFCLLDASCLLFPPRSRVSSRYRILTTCYILGIFHQKWISLYCQKNNFNLD